MSFKESIGNSNDTVNDKVKTRILSLVKNDGVVHHPRSISLSALDESKSQVVPQDKKLKRSYIPCLIARKSSYLVSLPSENNEEYGGEKELRSFEDNHQKQIMDETKKRTNDLYNFDSDEFDHAESIHSYMREREKSWIVKEELLIGDDKTLSRNRSKLIDWIVSVVHHFKMSQETLYHTISLIDRTLGLRTVQLSQLQLLGLSSFFIASKLEEYYAVDVRKLVKISQNSYSESQLLSMEKTLLEIHDFRVYGAEPMTFINFYLRGYESLKNLTTCLVDGLSLYSSYSELPSSKVVSAAVASACLLHSIPWSRQFSVLTSYSFSSLRSLMVLQLQVLIHVLKASSSKDPHYGVKRKYSSKSLHQGLIGTLQPGVIASKLLELTESKDQE